MNTRIDTSHNNYYAVQWKDILDREHYQHFFFNDHDSDSTKLALTEATKFIAAMTDFGYKTHIHHVWHKPVTSKWAWPVPECWKVTGKEPVKGDADDEQS